jgi:hypothetical protein
VRTDLANGASHGDPLVAAERVLSVLAPFAGLKAGGEAMRFAGWRARCGRFGSGCGGEGLERADCDGNGHEGSRGVHHALGMKRSAASWLLKPRIHRMRPLMPRWSCSSRLLGSTWSGQAELSDKPRARVVIWPLCDLPGCAASADP